MIKGQYGGVSKNTGTPNWMVYFMENPMNKWMIWGGNTPIFGSTPMDCNMVWSFCFGDLGSWLRDF